MLIKGDYFIKNGPFRGSLESLRKFKCPSWFMDAKFGIWSHWGPQSVPMYGDWYARNMYIEGSDQYRYHCRKYGHPSKFGYKDIVNLWKAENFNAEELMELFVDAGAKYFVAQGMHHDNFDNFNSTYQPRFNSLAMGPQKDIVGEWQMAANKYGLPFGVTEHLGASYGWFGTSKDCDLNGMYKGVPYDGNENQVTDLYYQGNNGYDLWKNGWLTENEAFQRHWFLRVKDLIDKYKPDFLYSDSVLPFGQYGIDIVAHLYNTSAEKNGGENNAVYTQKDTNPDIFSVGILDIERSQEDKITDYYWQTDTSIGDWFYNVRDIYKPWNVIMETLVDIASKNGNLLLNVVQKPDGTIDDECRYTLEMLAKWMKINGEGIFETRPWRVSGEGTGGYKKTGGFDEQTVNWNPGDIRFTYKDSTIFAFLMRWPGETGIIRALPVTKEQVKEVTLLGVGNVEYTQTGAGLVVKLPKAEPSEFVSCLKISIL